MEILTSVLLEFNLIAYVKYQIPTKLLFMLALSTQFSLALLTHLLPKEKNYSQQKVGG